MTEHRTIAGAARTSEAGGEHFVTLQVVAYNILDDYRTVFLPGVFDESLRRRLPTLAFGHSWMEPIGRAVSFDLTSVGPAVRFRFDNFASVPTAGRVFAQVKSGTLDECSVGFSNSEWRRPTTEELKRWPGVERLFTRADLDEVSLVLRGAVPGAKVLELRSANPWPQVDVDAEIRTIEAIGWARRIIQSEFPGEYDDRGYGR